jgi:hypothetical protein
MYLYSYFITYFLITIIVLFSKSVTRTFVLIFLLQAINIFFLKFDEIYDYQNYKIMFDNPSLSLDLGWRIISSIIGSAFINYNIPIILIILLNILISSSIVFYINNNSILQKSILIFLLIKWSMYEFITLRFGLASILCLSNFIKIKPTFYNKYIIFLLTSLLHYSILIFSVKYFWNKKWKLVLIFSFVLIAFPFLYTLDPRILHYLDAGEMEFSYSVLFTMLFFIALFLISIHFEIKKSAFQYAGLLIIFSIAIILFQKFDTFNRVFFGLFILSAMNWARTSKSTITKNILTFCFLFFSQIVLLRYTFFASDINKLIYK